MTTALPMESRRTRLQAPGRALVEHLYQGAVLGDYPWLWRGLPEVPPRFEDALWRDVLVQYAIEDRRSGAQIGLVGAYGANPHHGYAYLTLTFVPGVRRRIWPLEGLLLFGNILFTKYNLQNLYSETTPDLYDHFRSGVGRLFSELGRFPGRILVNGERTDLVVTGMSRAQWDAEARPLFERCTRPRGGSS